MSDLIVKSTYFARESVVSLRRSDFDLDSKSMINLVSQACTMILFYTENTESHDIAKLWGIAASQTAGPIYAACNLIREPEVAKAFTSISSNLNHPLNWAGLRQSPFIMVYRNGWPQAFFNGQRTVQTFIDYGLTLACQGGYFERDQLNGGAQAEDNFEMGSVREFKEPTSSVDFKSENPLRGYNNKLAPVIKGSSQEQEEVSAAESGQAGQAKLAPTVPQGGGGIPIQS